MSYNGSGVYSLPAGSTVTNGDTSDATDINTPLSDLAAAQNYARPIVAGGTGAATASAARDNLLVSGKVLDKSSGYTALAADRAKTIRCTAALTLDLTAAATVGDGWYIHVLADGGSVTVDPNGAETIDGATTLSVSDGNSCVVVCDGTSFYSMFLGAGGYLTTANNLSDLASAATARTNLGLAIGTDVQAHSAALDVVSGTNTGDEVAATDTTAGIVELATTAEGTTGTATDKVPAVDVVKSMIDTHAGGGGARVFLATADLASDTTVDFTAFDAASYDLYIFELMNVVPATSEEALYLRTSTNGGSTYDSGASDYTHIQEGAYSSGTTFASGSVGADSGLRLTGTGAGPGPANDSNTGISGTVVVYGPHLAKYTEARASLTYDDTSTAAGFAVCSSGGARESAADVDAIRFFMSSGNLTSGTITMYGVKNA